MKSNRVIGVIVAVAVIGTAVSLRAAGSDVADAAMKGDLPALQRLLRVGLVLPEVGRGGAQIELVQFAGKAGFVKAPSAGRRSGWRDPGIA